MNFHKVKIIGLLFLCFQLITACAEKPVLPTPPPNENEVLRELINKKIQITHADTEALDVFYITNREMRDNKATCSNKTFGINPNKGLHYGICKLNIPKKSRVGDIQSSDDPRADSHSYYRFQGGKAVPEEHLKSTIIEKKPKSLLVFTHGFNVKFEEAVMRAGQIAYDLKYQGLPIAFTWAAGSEDGFASSLINKTYEKNFQSALTSQTEAASCFRTLKDLKIPLHVLVHSMGHQVILPALDKLSAEIQEPFIDELILNAPDLSVDDFQKFAPSLRKVAKRVTVYCSFNDNAIAASETFNSNRRLGACATADGIDVINVSEVDAPTMGIGLGHGYYSSRPIITDVNQLLMGIEAEKRMFLRKSEPNSVENYYLRP